MYSDIRLYQMGSVLTLILTMRSIGNFCYYAASGFLFTCDDFSSAKCILFFRLGDNYSLFTHITQIKQLILKISLINCKKVGFNMVETFCRDRTVKRLYHQEHTRFILNHQHIKSTMICDN